MTDDLAARVASRICHDLVNPLGAVSNGVELLSMTGDASGPEMALVEDSLKAALARVNLFRIAFGAPAPDQTIAASELTNILSALGPSLRVRVIPMMEGDLPRDRARLLLLLLLCSESAFPFGGEVQLKADGMIATGDRMQADPELWEHLSMGTPIEAAANVIHFVLARDALPHGAQLTIGDGTIRVAL
ncbi:MAG: histidine phosphotransferase family protein [Shimia sp.]